MNRQSHQIDYALWLDQVEEEERHRMRPKSLYEPETLAIFEKTRTDLFQNALKRPPRTPMDIAWIITLWSEQRARYGAPTPEEGILWARACGHCQAFLAAWSLNAGESLVA
jgi:hypothetical protein